MGWRAHRPVRGSAINGPDCAGGGVLWVVVTLSLASGTSAQTPPPAVPSAHAGAKLRSAAQAVPTPAARPLQKADVDAWLDGFFPPQLQAGDIAGAVVIVVKDGQMLTPRGYGYADVQARRPVDPATTMFRVGSESKLFTWTAVWTAWLAWTAPRGWFAKLWATLLVAAAVMAWWGALAFHLIGFGHDY